MPLERDILFCCSWRSHSGILYLGEGGGADFRGGGFAFVEPHTSRAAGPPTLMDVYTRRRKVVPKCGTFVTFKSDVSTLHGVSPVQRGVRHASAFWFTDAAGELMRRELIRRRRYGEFKHTLCLTDPGVPATVAKQQAGKGFGFGRPARRCKAP